MATMAAEFIDLPTSPHKNRSTEEANQTPTETQNEENNVSSQTPKYKQEGGHKPPTAIRPVGYQHLKGKKQKE